MPSAGYPGRFLVELISRHALAAVFGVFVLAAIVYLAASVLGPWLVGHRGLVWRVAGKGWAWLRRQPPVAVLRHRYPRLFAFLRRRLTPGEYLGFHLAAGFFASAGIILFVVLAQRIVGQTGLTRFDLALTLALHQHGTAGLTRWLLRITLLGSSFTVTVVGIATGLLLLFERQNYLLAVWVAGLAGGGLLNQLLKWIFQRARPEFAATYRSWSFPSGHAMVSLITYGLLAYLITLAFSRQVARWVVPALALLVLFIGFSRVYLGVHYFSDVVAGYGAGTVWLVACITAAELIRRRRSAA